MDEEIKQEIINVSTTILKKIEDYSDDEIVDLYRKSYIPIYYKQTNFTYYFLKYIDILNFFILNTTINLSEVIEKIKAITWFNKDRSIGMELIDIDTYIGGNDDYGFINFINGLNIDNITDFSKFKFLNHWFKDTLNNFDEYKFRVCFNGTGESNNVNDYVLLIKEKQTLITHLLKDKFNHGNTIYTNFDYQQYEEFMKINNDINNVLKDYSNHEIFDISELQNTFSSFDKKDNGIENNNIDNTIKKNNKILIDLLYFINNGQINTRQSKEVQELLNSIISKLKDLPDTNNKIIDIIGDVFSLSLTSNRIGKTFNTEELRILNMQNQASETLIDLIINKIVKQGDYFISSTTGDVRDSTIYLLERYKYSEDNKKLYVSIIGINPLSGEKEKMYFDLLDKSLELNKFFDKCDYVRLKNMKETTLKDRQNVKLIGKYTYKI